MFEALYGRPAAAVATARTRLNAQPRIGLTPTNGPELVEVAIEDDPPMTKEEADELLKLLSQPIDFEALTESGVLEDSGGGWYAVLKPEDLPESARRQAKAMRSGKPGRGVDLKW